MSADAVLALWLAPDPAPPARAEWLRILIATRAAGRPLTLLDLRPPGVPDDPSLTPTEQRWLDALTQDGVALTRTSAPALRAALLATPTLACLAGRARPGKPALLLLDADLLACTPDAALLDALRSAGQVLIRQPT